MSQVFFPLIAGVGVGMLFHAPFQIFTRILKPEELASGTSAFFLVRFTGATIGLVSGDVPTSRYRPADVPPSRLQELSLIIGSPPRCL